MVKATTPNVTAGAVTRHSMSKSTARLALDGVRVLDLTQFLSGPYCTQVLGDLGAEVIKVEGLQGDLARGIPPYFEGADSVYYLSVNRNKRSVAIDLKLPDGLQLLKDLILKCDVVVENFRPGVLERLGVSSATLCKSRPSLIWCAISGFGQTGPYRDKPAYDMIVQALSGGMSLTGESGGAPVRSGIPIGDIAAGMYAAVAILAALCRVRSGGLGDCIDISMLDCQVAMLSYQAAFYLKSGKVPGRQGSGHDSIPTYRSFIARDGVGIVITANTEKMWQGLCDALDKVALLDDSRFKSAKLRYTNRKQLWEILDATFLERDAADWIKALESEQVPVALINTLDRVFADPQVQAREMILSLTSEHGTTVRVAGDPIRTRSAKRMRHRYPPALGHDTRYVLSRVLGLNKSEIAALVDRQIVKALDWPPVS
jgi:crotonobetainyl-CoA:carnitine CoA-transferase CaiB-like acyl-CoA transferase